MREVYGRRLTLDKTRYQELNGGEGCNFLDYLAQIFGHYLALQDFTCLPGV